MFWQYQMIPSLLANVVLHTWSWKRLRERLRLELRLKLRLRLRLRLRLKLRKTYRLSGQKELWLRQGKLDKASKNQDPLHSQISEIFLLDFSKLQQLGMDKLQLTGQNQGRVFNFRKCRVLAVHLRVKLPNLKLKTHIVSKV
jgi:hypothetical protein